MGISMATKCIVCGKTKAGTPVSEDIIIQIIRKIKQAFNVAKNNNLVVCSSCISEHKKKRAEFEKKLVRYGGFGAIIALLFLILSFSLKAILGGLFIFLLMLSFTLTSYYPAIKTQKTKPKKVKQLKRKRRKK